MNAQTEIDRIMQNVADTYSALEEKGATMPAEQNSDNLAATARTVPAGGTTGVTVQADWNQTDETAADFIKNKPFGGELVEIMPETELIGAESDGMYSCDLDISLFSGTENKLKVIFDGVEYACDVDTSMGIPAFGDFGLVSTPFVLAVSTDFGFASFGVVDGNPHMVAIYNYAVVQIPTQYVPKNKKRLYIDHYEDGSYLATDIFGENAITKEKLQAIVESDAILELISGFNGTFCFTPTIIALPSALNYGYVVVNVPNAAHDSILQHKYYTAEYTQPTT